MLVFLCEYCERDWKAFVYFIQLNKSITPACCGYTLFFFSFCIFPFSSLSLHLMVSIILVCVVRLKPEPTCSTGKCGEKVCENNFHYWMKAGRDKMTEWSGKRSCHSWSEEWNKYSKVEKGLKIVSSNFSRRTHLWEVAHCHAAEHVWKGLE